MNALSGITSNNPLPNHTNDKDPADEFADFLMNKIKRIRDNHTANAVYQPTGKNISSVVYCKIDTKVNIQYNSKHTRLEVYCI